MNTVRKYISWIYLGLLFAYATVNSICEARELALIIRNGTVIDGTGAARFQGDIGIHNGKIVKLGDLSEHTAEKEIDATGKIVSPGFIDMMGQNATPMIDNPQSGLNLLSQGITTINAGEGISAAPLESEQEYRVGYTTMSEYFQRLDSAGIPINVAQTIGHTQIRRIILGDTDRRPSNTELAAMQKLVQEAMDAGAIGLSSALIYPPAVFARTKELSTLANTAGRSGGRYFTHMRNEGDQVLEAVAEAIEIGRDANAPVHIFHLKAAGKQNWDKMPGVIREIQEARKNGLEVTADIYPYLHNGLRILAFIHPRHFANGREQLIAKLDDASFRSEVQKDMETTSGWENWFRHVGKDWSLVIVGKSNHPQYTSKNGLSIGQIAKARGEDPWDTFFNLASVNAFVLPETMSSENKQRLISEPFVSYCTDVGPADTGRIASHPRSFGSFPRVLHKYAISTPVISLEQAIENATSKAAKILFAEQRGAIKEGWAADLVVFDPEKIMDLADFKTPNRMSKGIDIVVVNGVIAFENQKYMGTRSGVLLRGPGYKETPSPTTPSTELEVNGFDNFEKSMKQFLKTHAIPGASIAVANGGKLIFASGYGYSDLAKKEPVTPNSLFRIASLSKPITAVAVLQLAERGQVSLNDSIYERLGLLDDEERTIDPRLKQITIKHLLEHRGGWDRDQSFDPMFQSTRFAQQLDVPSPANAAQVIQAMMSQPLDFAPGARYAYSNFGYCLLGRLIETTTNQKYEDYVIENVLAPLGIQSMRLGNTKLQEKAPGEVRYYHPYQGRSIFPESIGEPIPSAYGGWYLEAMDAHGGWIASAEDLAKFASAFDNPDACPILSGKSIALMHQRPPGLAGADASGKPKDVYYSLGWSNRVLPGGKMNHWHSGSLPGTTSIMIRRHDGKSFVGILNSRISPTGKSLGLELDRLLHKMVNEARF